MDSIKPRVSSWQDCSQLLAQGHIAPLPSNRAGCHSMQQLVQYVCASPIPVRRNLFGADCLSLFICTLLRQIEQADAHWGLWVPISPGWQHGAKGSDQHRVPVSSVCVPIMPLISEHCTEAVGSEKPPILLCQAPWPEPTPAPIWQDR